MQATHLAPHGVGLAKVGRGLLAQVDEKVRACAGNPGAARSGDPCDTQHAARSMSGQIGPPARGQAGQGPTCTVWLILQLYTVLLVL